MYRLVLTADFDTPEQARIALRDAEECVGKQNGEVYENEIIDDDGATIEFKKYMLSWSRPDAGSPSGVAIGGGIVFALDEDAAKRLITSSIVYTYTILSCNLIR